MSEEDQPAAGKPEKTREPKSVSSITRRILAINVLALAVLVFGLLFVGQYRQSLIDSEITSLTTQAEMFAAAIGEAAVGGADSQSQYLRPENAGQIIRRLAAATGTQAQLVSTDGKLVSDSTQLAGPGGAGGVVKVEELPPPPEEESNYQKILNKVDRFLRNLLRDDQQVGPPAPTNATPAALPETGKALTGNRGHAVRLSTDGILSITVAVPVQRYKHVLGALILSKDTSSIDDAVFQVRLDILKVFGIALLVTILLSIYLAGTIARPLHRLAAAADHIRQGLGRQYTIPDMGKRSDEIGHLSAALREMTEALWLRMDAIERFAADVSHEIKNPLTSLRSAVETAARIDDPDQQKKLMSIILDDIQRLDRLISDISDASRLDAELSRAEMEPVDLGALLNTLSELHQATIDTHGTPLDLDIDDGAPMVVRGLEDRLVQVFRNIISNAISFTPEGGRISVAARQDGGNILITFDDQGPGIPDGLEANIFERFYQERPAEEKFGTHSGLGLSISKQIVETHGGRIWAENRIGTAGVVAGARFLVQLPAGGVG